MPIPSLYQLHKDKWLGCTRCSLCKGRDKVVLAKGTIGSTDICLIGEAPGESEDFLGRPFAGQAGLLLDEILAKAIPQGVTCAFTNVVACIPRIEGTAKKANEPEDKHILACKPRLIEFLDMCEPQMIVCVGKLASKWLPKILPETKYEDYCRQVVDIMHPSAILQTPIAGQSLAIQRCIVVLARACEKLIPY